MFQINELIDGRNRRLYEEVQAAVPIELEPSEDDCWGAITMDGTGYISYAPTDCPIACFTHELLHIKQDVAGNRRPGYSMWAKDDAEHEKLEPYIEELIVYSYNQLIHHRMFPEFIAIGFPADQFVDEPEDPERVTKDIAMLENQRADSRRGGSAGPLIWPFLFASCPHDPKVKLLQRIKRLVGNRYYSLQNVIDHVKNDPKPDMRRCLGRLFYLCDLPNVGFGPDEESIIWARDCTQE